MKLILPVFIFFAFSLNTFSQSIALLNAELEKTVAPGAEVKTPLQIKNTSEQFIRLAVKQINATSIDDQPFSLCFQGNCWDDLNAFESIKLAPGQTLEGLSIKFRAGFDMSVHDLELNFYNADNPIENLSRTFKFSVKDNFSSNGILFSQEGIQVSSAYPNPVSSFATIDYDIANPKTHAKIVIHNLLGSKVMEIPLEKGEMNVKVSTDALDNGIYFYSLHIDEKRVATKKMVVKK